MKFVENIYIYHEWCLVGHSAVPRDLVGPAAPAITQHWLLVQSVPHTHHARPTGSMLGGDVCVITSPPSWQPSPVVARRVATARRSLRDGNQPPHNAPVYQRFRLFAARMITESILFCRAVFRRRIEASIAAILCPSQSVLPVTNFAQWLVSRIYVELTLTA